MTSTGWPALVLSVMSLFAGAALLWGPGRSERWRAGLDGLMLTVVTGICLLHLGPHALDHGGLYAVLGAAGGAVAPGLLVRRGRGSWWGWGAMGLLGTHAALDGAALAVLETSLTTGITAAVVAHRLPIGMIIALRAPEGRATAILLVLSALTVGGFVVGAHLPPTLGEATRGLLEGLIVGGLLHAALKHSLSTTRTAEAHHEHEHEHEHEHGGHEHEHEHGGHEHEHEHGGHHHHEHEHEHSGHSHHGVGASGPRHASALGALLGGALLFAFFVVSSENPTLAHVSATGRAFLSLTLTSAPALLAGFLLAGLVSALIHPARSSWLGGGRRSGQALRGLAFGLPLPICSCGVVPMYQSLVRRGAPLTAALAFLVATPELGLDAVLLSIPLLGLPLTAARVFAAAAVALLVALMIGGSAPGAPSRAGPADANTRPLGERLREGLRYGLVELVDHTLPWIVLGLLIAALAEPLLDHELLLGLPPAVQVPLAALLGIPLYVCASGATPLAAVAIHKGLSAGAALTFLLAGPATNVTTFGVLSALHGRGLAIRFGVALTITAVFAGWTVDALGLGIPQMPHPGEVHAHSFTLFSQASAVVLLGLGVSSLLRQGARGAAEQVLNPVHDHG